MHTSSRLPGLPRVFHTHTHTGNYTRSYLTRAGVCFRAKMPSSRDNTAITEASIKAASKQFDLSVVFKLSMARMGIQRIENLTLVPSLTVSLRASRNAWPV